MELAIVVQIIHPVARVLNLGHVGVEAEGGLPTLAVLVLAAGRDKDQIGTRYCRIPAGKWLVVQLAVKWHFWGSD